MKNYCKIECYYCYYYLRASKSLYICIITSAFIKEHSANWKKKIFLHNVCSSESSHVSSQSSKKWRVLLLKNVMHKHCYTSQSTSWIFLKRSIILFTLCANGKIGCKACWLITVMEHVCFFAIARLQVCKGCYVRSPWYLKFIFISLSYTFI